jgi:DNA polymerase I-like protein with 3'-5' exonuclease and polymerase domains
LKAWGETLSFPKGDYEDWTQYSEEMLEYCKQDVLVSEATFKVLVTKEIDERAILLEQETYTICSAQVKTGWEFDIRKAIGLMSELKQKVWEIENEVREVFIPLKDFLSLSVLKRPKLKNGELSKAYANQLDNGAYEHPELGWGMDIYPEFNLGSRQQIGKHLQHYGWLPKEFTPTGQPIVNEKVLETIEIPQAQLIQKYLMLQKRIALLSSWIEAVTVDNRIHGYVNSCGAVTGRMTHSKPNLAQVPASYSPYGKECRELFTSKQGYNLVGVDASGLELRMLAHYMNDTAYTKEILEGDIHTANQLAAGLETRAQAKTFIYAFLYGAGEEKIGEIAGGGAGKGRKLKNSFLKANPKLKELRDNVTKASKKGTLKGLDGRDILIRSEHAALNALLQSAGAIVMKQALIYLVEYADNWNLDYKIVGNIHDEIQSEVSIKDSDKFGYLAVECIKKAGQAFNMRCPLDGEYSVGDNWSQTH